MLLIPTIYFYIHFNISVNHRWCTYKGTVLVLHNYYLLANWGMYRLPGPGGHVFQGLLLLVAHGRGREGLVLRRLVVVAALPRLVVVAALRHLVVVAALRHLVVVAALRRLVVVAALRRLVVVAALRRLVVVVVLRRLVVVAAHDPARIINHITMVNITHYVLNWLLYQWKRVLCNQTKPKTTSCMLVSENPAVEAFSELQMRKPF